MMRLLIESQAWRSQKRLACRLAILVEERGATATEYSILVFFIALVITAGVGIFGIALDGEYGQMEARLKAVLGIP